MPVIDVKLLFQKIVLLFWKSLGLWGGKKRRKQFRRNFQGRKAEGIRKVRHGKEIFEQEEEGELKYKQIKYKQINKIIKKSYLNSEAESKKKENKSRSRA